MPMTAKELAEALADVPPDTQVLISADGATEHYLFVTDLVVESIGVEGPEPEGIVAGVYPVLLAIETPYAWDDAYTMLEEDQ
jgi:hypothetical protein